MVSLVELVGSSSIYFLLFTVTLIALWSYAIFSKGTAQPLDSSVLTKDDPVSAGKRATKNRSKNKRVCFLSPSFNIRVMIIVSIAKQLTDVCLPTLVYFLVVQRGRGSLCVLLGNASFISVCRVASLLFNRAVRRESKSHASRSETNPNLQKPNLHVR